MSLLTEKLVSGDDLVIPRSEYKLLLRIALQASRLLEYQNEKGKTFDFMVDHFKTELTKSLNEDEIQALIK
jgi:hypothetical protein